MTAGPGGPPRARLRRLSAEEIELWLSVAASVKRRAGSVLPAASEAPSIPTAAKTIAAKTISPKVAAPKPAILQPPAPKKPAEPPLAPLERKLKQRLSRGRTTADAAIDLHGFRQDEAHGVLLRFLRGAQRDGLKVVLVVTGKGHRIDDDTSVYERREVGVLRRAVPIWLGEPAFRTMVVGFEEAGRSHGGSGALYVRVRKGAGAVTSR